MKFEIRPPKFLSGEKVEPHQAKPLDLQHLSQHEVDKYGGNIIDLTDDAVKTKPGAPKQLPPAQR